MRYTSPLFTQSGSITINGFNAFGKGGYHYFACVGYSSMTTNVAAAVAAAAAAGSTPVSSLPSNLNIAIPSAYGAAAATQSVTLATALGTIAAVAIVMAI
jgi:hypothetical protein